MSYTLIIAEKPDAARRIAEALADERPKVIERNGAPYYEFSVNGKKHVCVPAVGHLFVLNPTKNENNRGWNYPVFDLDWIPTFTKKDTAWTEKYFRNIEQLAKGATEFIDAADVDTEGEVLLYNILRFICKVRDAKRMKFSTLTKDELVESYKNMSPHIMFPMLESGLTRHTLDALWGFNLTRALTLAMKSQTQKGFAILSSGRVQSPTLALLLERELEIRKFIPKPFWQLELHCKIDETEIVALHEKDKFWKEEEVKKVLKDCKEKDARVEDIKKRKYKQKPPFPFNTTDLQAEAYSLFKFSPTQTLNIAESLYQQGFISYPRSSIDYDEKIFVIDSNNRIKEVKIGKLIDDLIEKNYVKVKLLDNSEELEVSNYRTFTVNLKTNKIEVKPITSLIRHPTTEPLLELTTEDGRKIRVTKSHSLFVFNDGELKSVPTSELNVGDYIAIAKSIPFSSDLDEINLLREIVKRKMEKDFTLVNWKVNKSLLEQTYGKNAEYNNYRFRNSIPLSYVLNFVSTDEISSDAEVRAFSGKNKISFKIIQKITPSLARLLGYFSSEGSGWSVKDEKASYEVDFTQKENEALEDMKVCLKEVLKFDIKEKKERTTRKLRIYGKTPYYLSELLDVKGLSLTKKVPEIILSAPDVIVQEYLKAYFAGDGWVDTYARSICARTISKDLANGIVFLLLRLGIFARIYEVPVKKMGRTKHTSYEIEITGNNNVRKFSEKIGFVKKSHYGKAQKILNMKKLPSPVHIDTIPRCLVNWKKLVNGSSQVIKTYTKAHGTKFITIQQLRKISRIKTNNYLIKILKFLESDIGLSKIVSIREVKSTSNYVYDLSIEGTNYENFIGGFGSIILHNSSQKLPSNINYEKILRALATLPQYKKFCEELLAKEKLIPNEGPRTDPAHPAVYVTHEVPDLKKLTSQQRKLYDLIVRRTLSTFADEAIRESMNVILEINENKFIAVGKRTLEPGWTKIYQPYLAFEEQILPELKIGQVLKVLKLDLLSKETQPPGRYSQGSIIKEMEKRNLGTRATRAEILQTLYDRRYIAGRSIHVTKLGEAVTQALKEFCPRILSEELTRHFEKEMDLVFNGKKKREEVVEEAKKTLLDILKEFKQNEKKIGKKLLEALIEARREERRIGICPECGGELRIIRSKKSGLFFIGCSNYPKCKNAYPIPRMARIQATGKVCEKCNTPIVRVFRKGKRPFSMCLLPSCIAKSDWNKKTNPN